MPSQHHFSRHKNVVILFLSPSLSLFLPPSLSLSPFFYLSPFFNRFKMDVHLKSIKPQQTPNARRKEKVIRWAASPSSKDITINASRQQGRGCCSKVCKKSLMFEVETVWIPHCVYTYISLNVVGCLRCALLNALLHMQFNYYDGKASHDQRWILRGASHGRLRDQQKEKKKEKRGRRDQFGREKCTWAFRKV